MAAASWLTISPTSGSGDGTVSVSTASAYTGREARSTTVTFTASGVSDVTRTVQQAGKTEFVSFNSSTATATKAGGTVTISGTSNSSKLTFALGSGSLSLTLPSTYTANSVSTTNGAAISGDPGSSAEFAFSISFSVSENTTIDELSKQITVTDNAGNSATCTLTQAAGDPYLEVSPTGTISLTAAGTAVSLTVSSNTSWTVS